MEYSKKIFDTVSKLFYSQFGNIYASIHPDGRICYSFEKKPIKKGYSHMVYETEFLFLSDEVRFFLSMMGLNYDDQKKFMSETINKPIWAMA